ncbi:MAG: hypothetical protein AAF497_01310 [Planctomycetota bacterium]
MIDSIELPSFARDRGFIAKSHIAFRLPLHKGQPNERIALMDLATRKIEVLFARPSRMSFHAFWGGAVIGTKDGSIQLLCLDSDGVEESELSRGSGCEVDRVYASYAEQKVVYCCGDEVYCVDFEGVQIGRWAIDGGVFDARLLFVDNTTWCFSKGIQTLDIFDGHIRTWNTSTLYRSAFVHPMGGVALLGDNGGEIFTRNGNRMANFQGSYSNGVTVRDSKVIVSDGIPTVDSSADFQWVNEDFYDAKTSYCDSIAYNQSSHQLAIANSNFIHLIRL